MYKIFLFLHKSDDKKIEEHFKSFTMKYIKEFAEQKSLFGKVESNLLLDTKYSNCCEISAGTKKEMDEMMNTSAGKNLSKDMMDFHKHITAITVDFGDYN